MAVKFFHITHIIISHITNVVEMIINHFHNKLMTLWGHIVEMVAKKTKKFQFGQNKLIQFQSLHLI